MKTLVVANWKMNPPTWREARALFDATRKTAEKSKHVSLVVAPPAIYLYNLKARSRARRVAFALQDAREGQSGAHTGEISLAQAADLGASYVLVGHSEVRARGETNEATGRKVADALARKITPILCVGELARSQGGEHFAFIKEELRGGFALVEGSKVTKVLVAYEPVWAIGGEAAVGARDVHEMTIFIRKTLVDMKSEFREHAQNVKILYGGSVSEASTMPIISESGVDGLLVGHVSLDPARFAALVNSIG